MSKFPKYLKTACEELAVDGSSTEVQTVAAAIVRLVEATVPLDETLTQVQKLTKQLQSIAERLDRMERRKH
jgi:hypothetical protein